MPVPQGRPERSMSEEDQKMATEMLKAEIERNKTLERGPMYNMVLKYMPYLKQYDGGLLSKSSGQAARMSHFFFLVVLLFIF